MKESMQLCALMMFIYYALRFMRDVDYRSGAGILLGSVLLSLAHRMFPWLLLCLLFGLFFLLWFPRRSAKFTLKLAFFMGLGVALLGCLEYFWGGQLFRLFGASADVVEQLNSIRMYASDSRAYYSILLSDFSFLVDVSLYY